MEKYTYGTETWRTEKRDQQIHNYRDLTVLIIDRKIG